MNGESSSQKPGPGRMLRPSAENGPAGPGRAEASASSAPGASDRERLEGMFRQGLSSMNGGNLTQAIRLFELVLEEVPGHAQTERYLEEARNKKRQEDIAAVEMGGGFLLDQVLAGEVSAAAPAGETAPAASAPADTEVSYADGLYAEGKRLYERGSYREARELFEQLLSQSPSHSDAYFLAELCKAREADQRDLLHAELTAAALYEAGDFDGAAREWERVLDASPDHPTARQQYEAASTAAARVQPSAPAEPLPDFTAQLPPPSDPAPADVPSLGSFFEQQPEDLQVVEIESFQPGAGRPSAEPEPRRPRASAGAERPTGLRASSSGSAGGPAARDASAEAGRKRAKERPARSSASAPTGRMPSAGTGPPETSEPREDTSVRKHVRELFDAASRGEREGDLETALDMYRKILTSMPESELAQERASALDMALQGRRFKQAFDMLSRAKALSAKDPVQALSELRRALAVRPELEEAQQLLPLYQKAALQRHWLRRRPLLVPLVVGILVIVAALLWLVFSLLLPQLREHRITGLLHGASRLIGEGDFAQAEERILEARVLSPRSPEVRRAHGRLLLARGEPQAAADVFGGLMRDGVGSATDRFLLASALVKAGGTDEARTLLEELIAGDESFHAARREYAWLMLGQEQMAIASEQSNLLLSMQPQEPENAILAAAIFRKMGMSSDELVQLEVAFKRGIRQREPLVRYLDLLLQSGRLDDAHAALVASRSAFRDEKEYRLRQGRLAKRRGRLGEAEEAFRNALMMDDKNMGVALELAGILMAKQDGRAAERVLLSVMEKAGPDGPALVLLGDAQMLRDAPGQAAESYRKALALRPNDPDASRKLDKALRASKPR
jgi:tetratricopeptide (TPR) repeat protein